MFHFIENSNMLVFRQQLKRSKKRDRDREKEREKEKGREKKQMHDAIYPVSLHNKTLFRILADTFYKNYLITR